MEKYDVIIVGGGAAGVGVAVALKHAGVENVVILERHMIGASFAAWPDETRFITPSFPTNSIGVLDLNSVALGTSPAFILGVEHPTGQEYALHLNAVAQHYGLTVREEVDVLTVNKEDGLFEVKTSKGDLTAKQVVWAAGEFQYPKLNGFAGSKFCTHTATVDSYQGLEGNDFLIIGGYESGVDAAYHLALRDKQVRVFDHGAPWESQSSDPSCALSTYSQERMRDPRFQKNVQLFSNSGITEVKHDAGAYQITTTKGEEFSSPVPPLFAGGFVGSHHLVSHLFEPREDGFPTLNEKDESTLTPGIYLCGPGVRQEAHIFCFIYKYRQRFAVVAKAVASALNLPAEQLESYRDWGMYLDDLSCCGEECAC